MRLKQKKALPFSHLNFDSWQNLILVGLLIFYFFQFGLLSAKESFLRGYGGDYLAFWSIGKIADDKGFAEIYDIENLRTSQIQVLETLGMIESKGTSDFAPVPAPIFAFFVLPFQFLSRVDLKASYWIWTSINLMVLIGYLIFFMRKIQPENPHFFSNKRMLFLMLLSFPMVMNLTEGQVEVVLVVCMGEFIRNALIKKPLPSGIWLGGLLLKPQMLITIIPVLIFQKNWKVLKGFFASSGVILGISVILSGTSGMRSLIDLWFKYGAGIASNSPERMINWRMVGQNLNSSFGWIIALTGMALTLQAVYYLVRNNINYGTSHWVMIMLGIFSATLAITWHSHYHLASVLIPFLILCTSSQLINKKVVLFWAVSTPVILMAATVISLFLFLFAKLKVNDFGPALLGSSGFFANFVILGSVLQYLRKKNKSPEMPKPGNQPA